MIDEEGQPPILSLKKPKPKSTKPTVSISGTVSGSENIVAIVTTLNNASIPVSGLDKFKIKARLKTGRNIFKIHAIDNLGNQSNTQTVKVRYKPKRK